MAPKAEGAQYSKLRRDEEAAAAKEARALIPEKYFEAVEAETDGRHNPTTKLLKAVMAYLNDMASGPTVQSTQQQGRLSGTC